MRNTSQNQPLYTIGVVSELLDVHPETIRTWEKSHVIQPPKRRSGKRAFSEMDMKRLEFVRRLTGEGLSVRAVRYYLRLYPCWNTEDCMECIHSSAEANGTKPCWKEPGKYCVETSGIDQCKGCTGSDKQGVVETKKSRKFSDRRAKAHQHSSDPKSQVPAEKHPVKPDYTSNRSLHEVLAEANWVDKIQSTLQSIVINVAKEMRAKGCCLALFTPEKQDLRHVASYGLSEDYVAKCRSLAEKDSLGMIEEKARVITDAVENEETQYGELARREGIVSVLSVPVMLRGETLGILRVHTDQPRRFSEHDTYFAQTAASIGAKALEDAINNDDLAVDYDVFRQQLLEFEWGRWPMEINR